MDVVHIEEFDENETEKENHLSEDEEASGPGSSSKNNKNNDLEETEIIPMTDSVSSRTKRSVRGRTQLVRKRCNIKTGERRANKHNVLAGNSKGRESKGAKSSGSSHEVERIQILKRRENSYR